MPWLQVRIAVTAERAEALAELLTTAGALAVSLEDAGAQLLIEPNPGDVPLWEHTAVIGLFPLELSLAALRAHLGAYLLPHDRYEATLIADQDWARAWLSQYKPLQFGNKLWVCPSWCTPPQAHAPTIILDPGLAFGTGTHASTALCLEWLTRQNLTALHMIDYGCGSGILALAALRLGAAQAIGVDIDATALAVSVENAQRNGLEMRYSAMLPQQLSASACAPLVVANILAGPLIELAPALTAKVAPGGQLILAGLLTSQIEAVRAAYVHAFNFNTDAREEWALLVGTKRTDTQH